MYITDYNVNEISECKTFDKMIRLYFSKKSVLKIAVNICITKIIKKLDLTYHNKINILKIL